jgi:hypothetical protein
MNGEKQQVNGRSVVKIARFLPKFTVRFFKASHTFWYYSAAWLVSENKKNQNGNCDPVLKLSHTRSFQMCQVTVRTLKIKIHALEIP